MRENSSSCKRRENAKEKKGKAYKKSQRKENRKERKTMKEKYGKRPDKWCLWDDVRKNKKVVTWAKRRKEKKGKRENNTIHTKIRAVYLVRSTSEKKRKIKKGWSKMRKEEGKQKEKEKRRYDIVRKNIIGCYRMEEKK